MLYNSYTYSIELGFNKKVINFYFTKIYYTIYDTKQRA